MLESQAAQVRIPVKQVLVAQIPVVVVVVQAMLVFQAQVDPAW
jgi:hypothetical protein